MTAVPNTSIKNSATSEVSATPGIPAGHQYVVIPKKNIIGWDHPGVGINLKHWGPGTHLVTDELAGEINRILENYNHEIIRIMKPDRDPVAARKEQEMY